MTNTEAMSYEVGVALLPLATALAVGSGSDVAWERLSDEVRADLRARGWADVHGLTAAGRDSLVVAASDAVSEITRRSTWQPL